MSLYNETQKHTRTTETHEGGKAYTKSLENEWTNLLFSLILQSGNDGFYESVEEYQNRYIELTLAMVDKYGADFVGKAAVYARNELGMRTISELTAALLNQFQFENKRKFYSRYFRRPDGVGEVFGAIEALGNKRSHALVRGCCDYLSGLNEYQLAKYPMRHHKFNMFDIINITHANSEAIDKLKKGELGSADTWENSISNAQDDESKENEWKRLVEERKLGYLALIRNLRNIINCDFVTKKWIEEYLVPQIANKEAIQKSLVFPYQIYTTWKMSGAKDYPVLENALSEAFEMATVNVPILEGKSAMVIDVSGSMENPFATNSSLTIKEVCAVYAAALYLSDNDIDVYKFGNECKKVDMPKKFVNVFKLIEQLQDNEHLGYGTIINSVFKNLIINKEHYTRIFLFSDMQVMDGRRGIGWGYSEDLSPNDWFKDYCKECGKTRIYSFDLGNYHDQIVSDDSNIEYITALSDKVFDIIGIIDSGKSLVDIVKNYSY